MRSDLPDPKSPFFDQDVRALRRRLVRSEVAALLAAFRDRHWWAAGRLLSGLFRVIR